jgi:hypothetical protein
MRGVVKRLDAQELVLYFEIPAAIKQLLEGKHLYQSITLQASAPPVHQEATVELSKASAALWIPHANTTGKSATLAVSFSAPDVKLFCKRCSRLEAFNLVSSNEVLARTGKSYESKTGAVQIFVFSYLCQSCKITPEVFLIRREGLKLILCGRAPMEYIDIPTDIPREVQKFYRGALLAYQSGETLAGNFMLRTVIEQWARYATGKESSRDSDEIMDSYMASLPEDFKRSFSSMRSLYGELSNDIHGAVGSSELFEDSIAKINDHFEARRLCRISDPRHLTKDLKRTPNGAT